MLSTHRTAGTSSTATAVTTEEDILRAYNRSWRDTAFGRHHHLETCPRTAHRACGDAA
jgi:hypothetical protein